MRWLRRLSLAVAVSGALVLAPGFASASSGSHSYQLVFGEANVGSAASGDTIHVTCEANGGVCGTFSIHPKSIKASGEFEHFLPSGAMFAKGTWTATTLISFHAYGCGEVLGTPLPPNLCGGAVKFRATFSTPIGELPGIITVFCIVGPKAPGSHNQPSGEGVTVLVPGIVNFNHTVHGDNIFIKTS
jgi:hypothetical protein